MVNPNCSCCVCGKATYRPPKRIAAGERITCSAECRKSLGYADGRPRLNVDKPCGQCGKVFTPKAAIRKYCSRKCYDQAQRTRVSLVCPTCGITFERFPCDMAKSLSGIHYCSRQCAAKQRERRVYGNCAYCGTETWLHLCYAEDEHHPNKLMFCSRSHSRMYQLKHNGPNKLELDFAAAFPEWRFVGDGQFYLNDSTGAICPDFVHPSFKKAVELFGDFWHEGENPDDRISRFKSVGWECIVIWESEFREDYEVVKSRVAAFLSKGQNDLPA